MHATGKGLAEITITDYVLGYQKINLPYILLHNNCFFFLFKN